MDNREKWTGEEPTKKFYKKYRANKSTNAMGFFYTLFILFEVHISHSLCERKKL